MMPSHQEIETLLTHRWDEVRREKLILKENIAKWDNKLKDIKKLAGVAPRESEQEIASEIEQLEHQHKTTSQSKVQERNLLYEIDKLKQKKKAASSYYKYEGELNQLQLQLAGARIDLLEKEAALDDLAAGLRKVRLASRAGVNSADLVETTFDVPEEKIPLVVGKGGITIRSIEGDFGVAVEIDHLRRNVRLTGLPGDVQKAYAAIQTAIDTLVEDVSVSFETFTVLTMDKAIKLLEIQHNLGVTIEPNSSKISFRITGPTKNVEAAKKSIVAIASGRAEMRVDKSLVSSIIGKGGSVIRSITADYHVQININKDDESIEVIGLKSDVQTAVKRIQEMIEDNREVEEKIAVSKHVLLGCLLSVLRVVQKEHGVRIDAEGEKEDKIHSVKIKGMNVKVIAAKAHIEDLIKNYGSNSVEIEVEPDVVPAVLGKGGAGIKSMRERFPSANIDIEGEIVHIHCPIASMRQQIADEIYAIIGENYNGTLECTEDFAIMLKTSRATEIRDRILREFGVRMNIEKSNTAIKLKGVKSSVERAITLLTALKQVYVLETLTVSEEDYPVLLKSGEESLIRNVSERYLVDITANRKDLTLLIRGNPENVRSAIQHLSGFLRGEEAFGSLVIPLDDVVSPNFIGKGGSNVKKLEDELGVKFDILKSSGLLRIRGPSDKLRPARLAVVNFLFSSRVNEVMDLHCKLSKDKIDSLSRRLQDIFDADLEQVNETTQYNLRAPFQVIAEAKKYITEDISGSGSFVLPLLEHHVAALRLLPHFGLVKFHSKFQLQLNAASIELSGNLEKLTAVKRDFMRALHSLFQGETAFIDLSRACLRDIVTGDLILSLQSVGSRISCDRVHGSLWLVCPSQHLQHAQIAVESVYTPWKAHNSSLPIDDFMIPILVGKGGANISTMRKELDCIIDVDRTGHCVYIKGSTEDILANAVSVLSSKIDKLRAEHWETKMHPSLAPLFIGKNGVNINKFKAETGVNIDVDSKAGVIKINGPEEKVLEAKSRLIVFIQNEEKYVTLPRSFHLPVSAIPALIGTGGATIRELQEKSGAKIDVDRDSKKCTLRGKNPECETAFNMINEILANEGHKRIPRLDEVVDNEDSEEVEANENDKQTTAKKLSVVAKIPMSKSALKRLRRKERETADLVPDQPVGPASAEVQDQKEDTHFVLPSESKSLDVESLPRTAAIEVSSPIVNVDAPEKHIAKPDVPKSHVPASNTQHLVDFLLGKETAPPVVLQPSGPPSTPFASPLVSVQSPVAPIIAPSIGHAPPGLSAGTSGGRLTTSAPSIGFTSYRNNGPSSFLPSDRQISKLK